MDEQQKREMARHDYEDHRQEVFERLKMQAAFAEAGLKSLMLVNAGAIIGLFTFIGNGSTKLHIRADWLWPAFGCFVAGMAATLVAHIAAFFSQGFYYQQTQAQSWNDQAIMIGAEARHGTDDLYKKGFLAENIGVTAAVVALLAFVVGAFLAFKGVLPA